MLSKTFKQFKSYSLIGVLSVGLDFAAYNALFYLFNIDLSISKAISFILGSTNSFILNKKITFKSEKSTVKELFKFIVIYSVSLLVNYYTHEFFLEISSGYIPFLAATVISVSINFFGQKIIVFSK